MWRSLGAACAVVAVLGVTPAIAAPPHGVRTWEQAALTASIAQTSDGFVWFASLAGLHRFDGVTLAPVLPGLVSAARVLLATRDGKLWVATGGGYLDVAGDGGDSYEVSYREGGGGLIVIEAGQPTVVLPADGKPEHWVWSLAELPDGRVVAGTEDGLQIIGRGRVRVPTATAPGGSRNPIAALHPDGARLWIGTARGLMHWTDGGVVLPAGIEGPVRALAAARDGGTWVVMDRELVHARAGQRAEAFPAPAGSFLRSALAHPDGSTWLGTTTGLFRRAATGWERVDASLPEQTVRSLLVDREGSTWIAIKGLGVAQLHDTTVINLGRPEGMPTDGVLSVLRDADDRVWAATTAGLVEVEGLAVRPRFLPGADDWSLRNLARAPGGDLWLGFDRLVRRRGELVTRFTTTPPVGGSLRGLWAADDGALWAGWAQGGVTRYAGGAPGADGVLIGAPAGACAGPVEFIAAGQPGNVWLGGPQGVTRVASDGTRAKCFGLGAAGAFRPFGLAELADGTVWITGVGRTGLMRLRGDQALAIERAGFPGTSLYGVLPDGQGRLWFSSNRGVFRAAVVDLEAVAEERHASVEIHHVDAHNGMRSQDCASTFAPALAPWADGGVVVPTALGLSFIAPPERRARPVVRPIIESLQLDGVTMTPEALPALRPRPRAIEMRFAVPTFLPGTDLAVEYALHRSGHPTPWIEAAAARVARFEDLPAGVYEFQVRARANQMGGSDATSFATARLAFRVLAPWWEWPPLRAGVVVGLVLLGFAIHRARLRRLRARFELVQNERTRIARELHDGLAQLFVGVGYQLQALQRQVGEGQPVATALLQETREMVRTAQEETKRALWDLRAGFERGDLGRSLAGIVAQARTQLAVAVELHISGALPNSAILDHEVPRIVQEAITNAVRHGGAQRVAVAVSRDAGGLKVTIDDDGSGMTAGPEEGAAGMGLVGMRERAARAGGTLTVVNHVGAPGVCVQLTIPDGGAR